MKEQFRPPFKALKPIAGTPNFPIVAFHDQMPSSQRWQLQPTPEAQLPSGGLNGPEVRPPISQTLPPEFQPTHQPAATLPTEEEGRAAMSRPPELDQVRKDHRWLLNPERSALEGWNGLTELLIDHSGYLPKPDDPTGTYTRQEAQELPGSAFEDDVLMVLSRQGRHQEAQAFRQEMVIYRQLVRDVITVWRRGGLL